MKVSRDIEELFQRFLDKQSTADELQQLFRFFGTANESELRRLIERAEVDEDERADDPARIKKLDSLYQNIKEQLFVEKQKPALWKYYVAIAAILLAIATPLAYWLSTKEVVNKESVATITEDIKPGRHAATLTLSNGKQIVLSDQANGQLAQEAGIKISKAANGQLVYEVQADHTAPHTTNTLTTTRGETYEVILPDQTKVWLNAASSLTYSASLGLRGEARTVKLSGEAYFEVAHDKTRPFIVHTATQEVKVLGTHFNVNSYGDNGQTVTTLAEGSVQVQPAVNSLSAKVLKPGQKSVLGRSTINISAANLETDLAWKNGLFTFEDATVPEVMQQISRWYNIEVAYNGAIPNERISGGISRQSELRSVLKMLELIKISYKLENTPTGKKIIINP
ncbi:FecR family protein [Pedobacter sp.]|uniref:FecR family protein n=1 Tax=Pedobacter sp. TaxID=1411316 RepID=UPI00396CD1A2